MTLPILERPCVSCPTDEERDAAHNAWNAWCDEEQKAFVEFCNGPAAGLYYQHEAWRRTGTYRELKDREPEKLPEAGCVECDYTGLELTDEGRRLKDFMSRWVR